MSHRDDLLRGYETGNFLETVYACVSHNYPNHSALAKELATLHNEGLIDVVGAFESLENTSSKGPDFFTTRHIFEEALPHIDAPVLSIMRCVLKLYRRTGQDLAAGTIFNSFIDFSTKNPDRTRETLTEIEAHPNELASLLSTTLIAGFRIEPSFYLDQAICLCQDERIEFRRQAVFSIGGFGWPEATAIAEPAVAALERSATVETDDPLLAGIVKSGFALWQGQKIQESHFVTLITTALSKGDECTLHAASEILSLHTDKLTVALLDVLLIQLGRVKFINKGTLRNVDRGVSHLLKNNDTDKAIQFLENLLATHPDEVTMEVFDSTSRVILNNKVLLSKILTRWFLLGEPVLCDGVATIISAQPGDSLGVSAAHHGYQETDGEHIHGYGVFQPSKRPVA